MLLLVAVALTAAACGGGSDEGGPPTTRRADDAAEPSAELQEWRAEVATLCQRVGTELTAIPQPDGSVEGTSAYVDAYREVRQDLELSDQPPFPDEVDEYSEPFATQVDLAEAQLTAAERAIAAGDVDGATRSLDAYLSHLFASAYLYAMAGVTCGPADTARAAADLNVPFPFSPVNLSEGFGSLWVTEHDGDRVARVDPATGEVIATIDVPSRPLRGQAADGRMWMRTDEAIVAIDPEANAIDVTLAKVEVGPAANRFGVVDDALWICDGSRMHRYDPTTLRPVAVIELPSTCENVTASDELVVAFTYNQDDGESGTAAATLVDPAGNRVLASVDLPMDPSFAVILDDAVFLPGFGGSRAAVIDRSTFAVTSTDLGRATAGATVASNGRSIFVPTADFRDVLVVDASTFDVTDTIQPFEVWSVAVVDGSLWVSSGNAMLQRYDLGADGTED